MRVSVYIGCPFGDTEYKPTSCEFRAVVEDGLRRLGRSRHHPGLGVSGTGPDSFLKAHCFPRLLWDLVAHMGMGLTVDNIGVQTLCSSSAAKTLNSQAFPTWAQPKESQVICARNAPDLQ